MNVPNLLTMSRFVLIPVFLALFLDGHPIWALIVVFAAGITDMLDGYIARRSGLVTQIGIMLDPLADKLMMLAVVGALLAAGEIPWLAAGAMAFREVGMIAFGTFFHFRGKRTVPANSFGKLTTVIYYLAIVLLILDRPGGVVALWIAVGLSFVTSFVYLASFKELNGETKSA
ncbi:CDP-alcohol phosphatidyltransferase family protein [Cohnella rhizosphaerae]|uniref:CDP-diacylglycerol--glycerol-3-phosphate 3-phosphatidyltransferase n=1 Tax=Cohnella rhizosphaerae TaxID=1457232 RepID=A0A9X4KVR0_9BACL|nr:CDP-alcohol phosphatidyltransferase family protein [Cohnella rhizosphaerae]MDG0811787.1 CDP-alcohol phosphatidyltransferase family protein [Cohnella rhizosphaerae]